MAAYVLNTRRAVQVSIYVVRAFVRLRQTLAANADLAKKLDELESKVERLASSHDRLAAQTHAQFRQVVDALRNLMSRPPTPRRRPIGFVNTS